MQEPTAYYVRGFYVTGAYFDDSTAHATVEEAQQYAQRTYPPESAKDVWIVDARGMKVLANLRVAKR